MSSCRHALPYLKRIEPGDATLELSAGEQPVARRFDDELIITYVLDLDDGLGLVSADELESEAMSVDELHVQALVNLATRANDTLRIEKHGSIYAVLLDGNFEASVLLLDALWDDGALAELAPGGFTAALPARDVLAFGDTRGRKVAAELRAVVGRVWPGGDHLLTQQLYARGKQGWSVSRQRP